MTTKQHARVNQTIWADDDWRDLSPAAQHLYFVLLSHPSRSYAGVVDWRPKRLMSLAADWPRHAFDRAADELARALYIVVDEDTEEALIRSFLRHDPLMKQPYMVTAMCTAYGEIASRSIRAVLVHELQRLREDEPDLRWDRVDDKIMAAPAVDPETYPTGYGAPAPSPEAPADPPVDPPADPSVNPQVDPSGNPFGKGLEKGLGNPLWEGLGNPLRDPSGDPSVNPSSPTTTTTTYNYNNPTRAHAHERGDAGVHEHAPAHARPGNLTPVPADADNHSPVQGEIVDTQTPQTEPATGPDRYRQAQQIVNAFKRSSQEPLTDSGATKMRISIAEAFKAGHDRNTIEQGITRWAESDSWSPTQIPSFIDRTAFERRMRTTKRSNPDAWLALADDPTAATPSNSDGWLALADELDTADTNPTPALKGA